MFCTFSYKALGQKALRKEASPPDPSTCKPLSNRPELSVRVLSIYVFTRHLVQGTALLSTAFQNVHFGAEILAIYVTIFRAHIVSLGRIGAKILNYF